MPLKESRIIITLSDVPTNNKLALGENLVILISNASTKNVLNYPFYKLISYFFTLIAIEKSDFRLLTLEIK